MWRELDLRGLLQIAVGAVLGAAVLLAVARTAHSRSARIAVTIVACTTVGVVATIALRWPDVPLWVVIGMVSTAAPITVATASVPAVGTAAEARDLLRRTAATLTVHVVCGVAFALLGFVCSMSLVQAVAPGALEISAQ